MEILIGSILSLLGLAGLFWCIKTVLRAKKTAGSDEELRMSLQKVVPFNMAIVILGKMLKKLL